MVCKPRLEVVAGACARIGGARVESVGVPPETSRLVFELAVILVAISFGSFVKGVTGTGLPQIAIPVMAIFLGVERAVVIMAIPGVVTNSWLMWRHRAYASKTRDLPVLIVTGVVGAVIGTVGLDRLDASVLALILAFAVGLYIAMFLSPLDVHLPARLTRWTAPPLGFGAGVLQGATGISGPVVTAYMHGYRLERQAFIFSLVTLFQVFAVAQVVTLARIGLYDVNRLVESAIALVPIMTLLPLGARMSSRLSARTFDLWLIVLIGLSALKLLYDGVSGLLG